MRNECCEESLVLMMEVIMMMMMMITLRLKEPTEINLADLTFLLILNVFSAIHSLLYYIYFVCLSVINSCFT